MGLSHAPLSVVVKAVAVMTEDLLSDAVPQAWELLLEHDNEVSHWYGQDSHEGSSKPEII